MNVTSWKKRGLLNISDPKIGKICDTGKNTNEKSPYLSDREEYFKKWVTGLPVVAQQKQIWLASISMQIQSLASLGGLRTSVAASHGVGHRWGLDSALLWLQCRPAAVASMGPLAWKPLYVMGAALKRQKKKGELLKLCRDV